MSKRYFCFVFVAMFQTSLSGCAILTYDVKPEAAWKAPNTAISQPELLYEIHRTGFAWLPVLAVVWVNALTASEKDAFKAVTRQFFADASRDGAL
jgi:hypothetical protein